MNKLTIFPEHFSLTEMFHIVLPHFSWQGYNHIVLLVFSEKLEDRSDFERVMELRWKKFKLKKKHWPDLSNQVWYYH